MKKTFLVISLTVFSLTLLELLLQIRAHYKYGISIFNATESESPYFVNPLFGVTTLRPNNQVSGAASIIVSNSLGLRDDEIPIEKAENEIRLVYLGASTVMGAYAANNQETSSNILEQMLNSQNSSGPKYQVINAGIAGLTSYSQAKLLRKLVSDYNIDGAIIYTGLNDLTSNCKKEPENKGKSYQLPQVTLPKWLLTYDLLVKNTVSIRSSLANEHLPKAELSINTSQYANGLNVILDVLKQNHTPSLFITNGKAYRTDQPEPEQMTLSENARYFNDCFGLKDLYIAYDKYNHEVIKVANSYDQAVLLALEDIVPGGQTYFADASHLTLKGEKILAKAILEAFVQNQLFGLK